MPMRLTKQQKQQKINQIYNDIERIQNEHTSLWVRSSLIVSKYNDLYKLNRKWYHYVRDFLFM